MPADEGTNLPDPSGLESYDGVVITGSGAQSVESRARGDAPGRARPRRLQVRHALLRLLLGPPGRHGRRRRHVRANPRGREVGIARDLTLTPGGRAHPLYQGKASVFTSPCVHGDEVGVLPEGAIVLARNDVSDVQAIDISHDGGTFWGIQYHPEFSLNELTSILRRYKPTLVEEGFFRDPAIAESWLVDLETLVADPRRGDIAWRYGIGRDVLEEGRRLKEIENFVERRVRPVKSERLRA